MKGRFDNMQFRMVRESSVPPDVLERIPPFPAECRSNAVRFLFVNGTPHLHRLRDEDAGTVEERWDVWTMIVRERGNPRFLLIEATSDIRSGDSPEILAAQFAQCVEDIVRTEMSDLQRTEEADDE
jgi:hypothetical protein